MNKFSLIGVIVLLPKMIFAIGFGLYVPVGFGDAELSDVYTNHEDKIRTIYYEPSIGFGVMFDSNVAKASLLNYRLNLEYSYRKVHSDSYQNEKDPKAWRVNMIHTLGFGIYRSSKLRIWLGPRINLAYYRIINEKGQRDTALERGVAASLGGNYHVNDEISLSADIDYRVAESSAHRENEDGYNDIWYDATVRGSVLRLGILIRLPSDNTNEFKRVKRLMQRPL